MTMRRLGLGSVCAALLVAVAGPAQAVVYLVGAQFYACGADGTNGGPGSAFRSYYQDSTSGAASHGPLNVEGDGSSISFPLSEGLNVFDYATGGLAPGAHGCLNLFFSASSDSFDPPYDVGNPVPGDLTAIAPVAGGGLRLPEAGVDVQSYNSSGAAVIPTSYSGARRIFLDGREVRIAGFTVTEQVAGTFTVRLPEADAAAAAPLALAAVAFLRRRRAG